MGDLTHEDVLEILRAIDASTCEELVFETGDLRLVVRKAASGGVVRQLGDPVSRPSGTASSGPVSAQAVPAPPHAAREEPVTAPLAFPSVAQVPDVRGEGSAAPPGAVPVRAPMIGRFYRSPEPGAPPFVEVGSAVQPDDTVGLIEVMKLFNQIKAGIKGRVVAICAEHGQMVEFGQELMWIAPEA